MNKLVSLITRTKNRPIFIPRVFQTVVEQSYRPIEWIIVNDNGESIDALIEELKLQHAAQLDGIEISLINKTSSTGMEGASNTGLEHAHGFYIKLLDDDDTLDSACLEKQVHYMEHEKLPNERGVICHTNNIFEKIEDAHIHFISSSPLALTLENITIADLAMHNQFTIHSFLYEKEVLENIGTYNESLPVLGDWEFNLRFIMEYNIGVIPEFLANYHIRTEGNYSSTVVNQYKNYDRYEALIRNNFVRNKKYNTIGTAILNAQNIKQLHVKLNNTIAQPSKQEIQLFIDEGSGYQEKDSLKLTVAQNTETQEFVFDLSRKTELTALCINPLNDSCIIEIESLRLIKTDGAEMDLMPNVSANTCVQHGKSFFFETYNPQINFDTIGADVLTDVKALIARMRYAHIGRDAVHLCVNQLMIDKNYLLEQTKTELDQTKTELDQTKTELDQTKTELDQTKKSLSWRITQPLQKIKQILKGN
jgi:glycosyltransferase involved in cell wall biosynthesis